MARDLINEVLSISAQNNNGITYLDIVNVIPSDKNFYHIHQKDVEMMAYSIEAIGQIEQPLIVKQVDSNNYELIAGHKRRAGALFLVEQGKEEYRKLPCIIKDDKIENELSLIWTNSTQRELSSYEKMKQVEILRNYLEKYQIKGNKREIISKLINLSKSEIGRLENINKNLIEPLKKEFAVEKIATSTANEIASLKKEEQDKVLKILEDKGTIKQKDLKLLIKNETKVEEDIQIPGQINIEDYKDYNPHNGIKNESSILILYEELEREKEKLITNKMDDLEKFRIQIRITAFEYYINFKKKEGE